jgi:hypothetical protein
LFVCCPCLLCASAFSGVFRELKWMSEDTHHVLCPLFACHWCVWIQHLL